MHKYSKIAQPVVFEVKRMLHKASGITVHSVFVFHKAKATHSQLSINKLMQRNAFACHQCHMIACMKSQLIRMRLNKIAAKWRLLHIPFIIHVRHDYIQFVEQFDSMVLWLQKNRDDSRDKRQRVVRQQDDDKN